MGQGGSPTRRGYPPQNQEGWLSAPIQSARRRSKPVTTPSTVTFEPIRSSVTSSLSTIQTSPDFVVRIIPRRPRFSIPDTRIRPELTITPCSKAPMAQHVAQTRRQTDRRSGRPDRLGATRGSRRLQCTETVAPGLDPPRRPAIYRDFGAPGRRRTYWPAFMPPSTDNSAPQM